MNEKMKKNNNNINNEGGDKNKKKKGDGENKREEKKPITVVLKINMHCQGCASNIDRCARALDGVKGVETDINANKLTVIGNVDPSKIREKLNHELKKKVELISPQPKKDDDDDDNNNTIIKNDKKDSKPDEEKPKEEKETPVMTAVLKVSQHCQCQGCIKKIDRAVKETKGWHDHSLDKENRLVTVKGMMMDVKALAEVLKKKLKLDVEVVSPKEEKDGNNGGGGGGNDSGKKKKGGVQKGESSGGGDDSNSDDGGGNKKKVICQEAESGGGGDDSNGGGGGGNMKKDVWQEGESSGGVGKGEGTKTNQSRCGYQNGYQYLAYNAICRPLDMAISHTKPQQFTGNKA